MLLGHTSVLYALQKLAATRALAHSYLWWGPEGVGKRLTALHLAAHLEGKVFTPRVLLTDAFLAGPDNGSIGIDIARAIQHFLWQTPQVSAYRTVILDGAEYLTGEAQNALLKITEEPPASTLLLIIVRDPEFLQPTLISRLQKLYFTPVQTGTLKEWLIKEHGYVTRQAQDAATRSFGCPGIALAMLRDENFKDLFSQAQMFLQTDGTAQKDFIKKLIAPDDFNLARFLDMLVFLAAGEVRQKPAVFAFWHQLLRLRYSVSYFNLNPRLQLENLKMAWADSASGTAHGKRVYS